MNRKKTTKWGWISVVLSLLAIGASAWAALVSWQTRRDVRAIEGLDLHPVLRLRTTFKKIKDIPPHFTVFNDGPVEVRQLDIQLVSYRYSHENLDVKSALYESDQRHVVPRLLPLSRVSFPMSEHWLYGDARGQEPPHHNIMEIRLTYRRPPDMRRFVESAFYFVNPDGAWVREHSQSLTPEVYEPLKAAALKQAKAIDLSLPSDKLYPLEVEE